MRRKVTIEDIARQAGASVTTVSMVLRDKPGISAETRQRVFSVAREMGYRRRTPASEATALHTVAMILRSRSRSRDETLPSVNPFYSDVISGIETAARERRMNLLYATLPVDDDNVAQELPDHLLSQQLTGILLIGSFSRDTVEAVSAGRTTPTILVDAPTRLSVHDAVVSDNQGGAYEAVSYLIEHHHRHIALVGPDPSADPNFGQRREGYRQALREHHLPDYHITIQQTGPHEVSDTTAAFLQRHPSVTAIFGSNDAFTIEAMRGAQKIGRKIPADFSVIGFDDIGDASQVTPRLTTMAVDRLTMGRQAIQMLHHRIRWPDSGRMMTILHPELRVRDSVGMATEHQVASPHEASPAMRSG